MQEDKVTRCICPACGKAYEDTEPRNATEYTRLDRVVRLCPECYQIPGNIRERVMALRCKILAGKPFTATDRKWIKKTKGVSKWLYRQ